jgi:hypothetical protein
MGKIWTFIQKVLSLITLQICSKIQTFTLTKNKTPHGSETPANHHFYDHVITGG